MKRNILWRFRVPIFWLSLVLCVIPSWAQNGTPHGVEVSWNPVVPGADPLAISGYNVYRCAGTCQITSIWARIAINQPTNSYLDPAAGLTVGNTYSYTATAVDVNGNESIFSNIATTTISSSGFPTNPAAPAGCSCKQQ